MILVNAVTVYILIPGPGPVQGPPPNRLNLHFGYPPRPHRRPAPHPASHPASPNRRPVRRIPPGNFLGGNQQREHGPPRQEPDLQEKERQEEQLEEEEDSFYDDDFFHDPDFENFDFSDFDEFEVYDSNDNASNIFTDDVKTEINLQERPEEVEEKNSVDKNSDLNDKKEMDFTYSREGLEMYKKAKVVHESPVRKPDTVRSGDHQDFEFDYQDFSEYEEDGGERREMTQQRFNEEEEPSNSRPRERFNPELQSNDEDYKRFERFNDELPSNEEEYGKFDRFNDELPSKDEDYEKFEDFFTSFEPFGFEELPAGSDKELFEDQTDLDKLNVITDMFDTTNIKPQRKVGIDIVSS